ncbi:MAG: hypothetical protein AABY22_25310 [Nanoarchaeota archaeon]
MNNDKPTKITSEDMVRFTQKLLNSYYKLCGSDNYICRECQERNIFGLKMPERCGNNDFFYGKESNDR